MAVGVPVGSFWGSTYDGIWKSQEAIDNGHMKGVPLGSPNFRDLNGDGIYDAKDDSYIGNPNPKFIFGIANDFSYKNFSLNIFIYGEQGQDVANFVWDKITSGTNLLRSDREDRWNPQTNPNGNALPANQTMPSRLSTYTVEDGSFVRIKNISLSYDLPVKNLNINWMRQMQLSVAADNLKVFTNYRGYDPEVNSFGTTNDVKGVDLFGYPAEKTFRVGLKLGF